MAEKLKRPPLMSEVEGLTPGPILSILCARIDELEARLAELEERDGAKHE